MENPKYTHDCENCKFLGTHQDHDLYFCDNLEKDSESDFFSTVIARYGNEGSEYKSGMVFAKEGHILFEAKNRVLEMGLVNEKRANKWE